MVEQGIILWHIISSNGIEVTLPWWILL